MDLTQAFSVDHILFLVQMLSHAGASHNRSPLSLHIQSAEDISKDLYLHYQFVQAISRLLSQSSHFIQPVQSPPFNQSFNDVFLLSGP